MCPQRAQRAPSRSRKRPTLRAKSLALGEKVWASLKPALELRLARNPHRFTQIANTDVYAIPLYNGRAILFTIDFNHAKVSLEPTVYGFTAKARRQC